MLAKKYNSEIVSLQNPYEGIYTLEFRSLGRKYKFQPGQFLHLAIDSEYDGVGQWPESRCFSIQSNPGESILKITYAVKGDFTRQMEQQLKTGDEVWLKLPYGDLFQQVHSKDNTIFIAGGTGITPFLSLFTHASFNDYQNPKIYLGFRSKAFHIYSAEMNRLCNSSQIVKTFYKDIEGDLDIQKIFNENGTEPNYFISGPPDMVKIFKKYLLKNGVSIENILTDDWE